MDICLSFISDEQKHLGNSYNISLQYSSNYCWLITINTNNEGVFETHEIHMMGFIDLST